MLNLIKLVGLVLLAGCVIRDVPPDRRTLDTIEFEQTVARLEELPRVDVVVFQTHVPDESGKYAGYRTYGRVLRRIGDGKTVGCVCSHCDTVSQWRDKFCRGCGAKISEIFLEIEAIEVPAGDRPTPSDSDPADDNCPAPR